VISYVGKTSEDVSGAAFPHEVNVDVKRAWVTPLYPGKHQLAFESIELIMPTTNIVLVW